MNYGYCNQINHKGAKQIIKGLESNDTLSLLYLEGNSISEADIQAMRAPRKTGLLTIKLGRDKERQTHHTHLISHQ